jgi:hypothetical protein
MQQVRKDEITELRKQVKELSRRAAHAEALRANVLRLQDSMPPPRVFTPSPHDTHQAETIVLFLSDLHWGEVVRQEQVQGLNSYNKDIARRRLEKYFLNVIDLATSHWVGVPPERIVLILGGDMISGEIHDELGKTNDLTPLEAVKDLAWQLADGIASLAGAVKCPVEVIDIPGNHGRLSRKPEAKNAVVNSFDTLVCDFVESSLRNEPGVKFYRSVSHDYVFDVYGWKFLANHGETLGSRGGTGFIGPAATAARGIKNAFHNYNGQRVVLNAVLMGHFHTFLVLEGGIVNGSLVGYNQFAQTLRVLPQPASQMFLTVHPKRMFATIRQVGVGHPSEGALYL